jgi:hypothetical protein
MGANQGVLQLFSLPVRETRMSETRIAVPQWPSIFAAIRATLNTTAFLASRHFAIMVEETYTLRGGDL